jgi:hypothetical protein
MVHQAGYGCSGILRQQNEVVSRLGDHLRHRGVCVELPSEQVAVVAPEPLRILPDDFKMHNWLSHGDG